MRIEWGRCSGAADEDPGSPVRHVHLPPRQPATRRLPALEAKIADPRMPFRGARACHSESWPATEPAPSADVPFC